MDSLELNTVTAKTHILPIEELSSDRVTVADDRILNLIGQLKLVGNKAEPKEGEHPFSFSSVMGFGATGFGGAGFHCLITPDDTYIVKKSRIDVKTSRTVKKSRIDVKKSRTDERPRFLDATGLYILYGDNDTCWQYKTNTNQTYAKLRKADSLEVKGSVWMPDFTEGTKYGVGFMVRMRKKAKLDTETRFTIAIPRKEGPTSRCDVKTWLVDLKKMATSKDWITVNVGEFTATDDKAFIRFSLTNFDAHWKSGIRILGVLFRPQ